MFDSCIYDDLYSSSCRSCIVPRATERMNDSSNSPTQACHYSAARFLHNGLGSNDMQTHSYSTQRFPDVDIHLSSSFVTRGSRDTSWQGADGVVHAVVNLCYRYGSPLFCRGLASYLDAKTRLPGTHLCRSSIVSGHFREPVAHTGRGISSVP